MQATTQTTPAGGPDAAAQGCLVRFGVLGPFEVSDDNGVVEVGGHQARTLLAALVARAGHVVTADVLVSAIWGNDPPPSAIAALHTLISRLRRRLGEGVAVRRQGVGYRLDVDAAGIDWLRFEHLADEGRRLVPDDPARARAVLAEALELWRGPALAEFADRDFAAGLAARLEQRRLAALEDRITADLALGHHAVVIAELTELVAAQPLVESLRGHLATALYRAGRQADALRVLDDGRRRLRDELGVDPSPALRQLHNAILCHDPSLHAGRAAGGTKQRRPSDRAMVQTSMCSRRRIERARTNGCGRRSA
jgi:DNA-binding SARP family transcriptional activator